jgi:ribosomal protein L34E
MLILCDKCNQTTDAKINKKTGKPICADCGEVIERITSFAINAMKNNREYVEDMKQSFAFPCQKCAERRQGLVSQAKNEVVCSVCGEPMKVSPFMRETMKDRNLFTKS